MTMMQALVKQNPEPGLWLAQVPVPEVGPNDVRIRVLRTSICGTDVHIYNWDHWAERTIKTPMTIGHEYVGVIDAVGSNVFQTPAFIVLLHRFFDSVRPEIEHFERGNFELRQPLRLKHQIEEDAPGSWIEEFTAAGADRASASAAPRTDSGPAAPLRAPALPGFFSIRRGTELILSGSAYFADVSESDFNGFGPADIGAESAPRLIAGHHSLSSIMPLLLLVLGLLLIITWLSTGKRIGGSAPNLQAARTK